MRKMDSLGLKMCSYQANLFERSKDDTECSSKIFIRRFMNSDLAKRMDNVGFVFDSVDIPDAIIEIESQYGVSTYGTEKFNIEDFIGLDIYIDIGHMLAEKQAKKYIK